MKLILADSVSHNFQSDLINNRRNVVVLVAIFSPLKQYFKDRRKGKI